MAFDSQNGCVYVSGYAAVSVINGTTNSVITAISAFSWPWGEVFNPSNGFICVSKQDHNPYNVSIIDGATNLLVANVTVGIGPYGLAFDPENGYVYVANSGSGTVSVIATTISTTRFSTTPSSMTSSSTTSISTTSYSSSSSTTYSTTSSYTPSIKPTFITSVESPSSRLINIGVIGNISASQVSNMSLSGNSTITLSFTLYGAQESQGTATIAIPKNAVPSGDTLLVYMDGALALGQSYYSDQSNYYVSFAIQSGTHQVSIVFSQSSSFGIRANSTYSSSSRSNSIPSSNANYPQYEAAAVGILVVAALGSFALIRTKARHHPNNSAKS
jgi:YVTN family beta-propeller protein